MEFNAFFCTIFQEKIRGISIAQEVRTNKIHTADEIKCTECKKKKTYR
jgi:hypothetical protein